MPSELTLDPAGAAPRRLPPQALLIGIKPQSIIAVLFVVFSSGGLAIPVLILIAGVGLAVSGLAWSRFRYGYDGDVLRVEQGVLQRQLRAIDVGRVQQVELDQQVVHRVLGLARLRVETASDGGDAEVQLDGLLFGDATRLRDALRLRSRAATGADAGEDAPPPPPETTLVEVPTGDIALGAVTGSRLVFFPVVIGFLASQLFEFSSVDTDDVIDQAVAFGTGAGVLALALGVVALAIVVAVASAVLQEGNFRILRRGEDLVVMRGLLTRREAVVPAHRVQVVVVEQNWVRRLLGVATVEIRSGGSGVGNDSGRTLRIPLVRDAHLPDLLQALVSGLPQDEALVTHPTAARRRAIVRWSLRALVVTTVATVAAVVATGSLVWLTLLLVVPVAGVVLGRAEYANLAHGATERVLVSRDGALAVRRTYATRGRVQGVVRTQNGFQRRLGLATTSVFLVGAGGSLTITDAATADAQALSQHLTATPGRSPSGT